MSWAVEEWKEGLSTRALHKIQELESQLEKLKKERQQRQFQLESLEAALQKQKQKVENEKNEGATLKRENQNLMELCDSLEKTRQKLSHELQVKETQISVQEGQLLSSKKQTERLEQELKRYKYELEKSQKTFAAADISFNSTPQKNFTAPSTPSHNDSKFEELQVKYNKETEERRRLEAELKSVKCQVMKTIPSHPESTISRREIARQQASSSVFSWQQEKTPSRPLSSSQETPVSSGSMPSHFPWESGTTPSDKDRRSAKKEFTSSVSDSCKDSSFVDKMKIQNQELRSKIQELERNLQIQTQDLKSTTAKLQETKLQLEHIKMESTEKDTALKKSRNEVTRINAQLDQTMNQHTASEEKVKRLSEELNCQRQNFERAQHSLQQKMKEKEKEYQEEASLQLNQVKMKLQGELHQAKNNYNLLQAELEKTKSAKQQLEKKVDDFSQKLSRADQATQAMQLKESELKKACEETKKQNGLLHCQSAQQLQEICQLKEELCVTKRLLQQSQNVVEDMKNKNFSLEKELKLLEENLSEQENPLTLEKMKLAISELENQRDSLQQLLKHKENTIEELSVKLEDLEALQKVLTECEGLKKKVEVLSQWKKESGQHINELVLEKEDLMSKICSLERALMTEQLKSNERVKALEGTNENLCVEIRNLKAMVEDKTAELEAERKAHNDLQDKTAASEEKHRKERENNSLKLSEFTKQVDVLQKTLATVGEEMLEKDRCMAFLETSLASHVQLKSSLEKQCEELVQARDETERKLAAAEQRHKDFVREKEKRISELEAAVSEKQDLVTKTLQALQEKNKTLQALIAESERQQAEILNLRSSNSFLEDTVQQLKITPQTVSHKEPDALAPIALNKKLIEGVSDENLGLKIDISALEQRNLDVMQTSFRLSRSQKEREESLLELSERPKEKSLLLSKSEEESKKKCGSVEAENKNLECALREQACHSEVEKATFEEREKQLMNEHEELKCKVVSLEKENNTLLQQLEKMQAVPEETEILGQERAALHKMQHHNAVLLQENEELVKELEIRDERAAGGFPVEKTSLGQLRGSVEEKEEELNKYQVQLELLQMDLEDREASVENYADQVKQLESALRTMEIKLEENETERERLNHELQALKDVENPHLELTEEEGNGQSAAHFNAVSKDNFSGQIDAKCSSVPHDLMPSQSDYVRLVASLHMTMSKLNELEKMFEHLQIEKSTLASQLKDSQLKCITGAMAEELIGRINNGTEESAAFSGGLIDHSKIAAQSDIEQVPLIALECCDGLDCKGLKPSSKEIKMHFDGVKEKIFSLKNEYSSLQEQHSGMAAKISELQSYVDMLKEENAALSTSLDQVTNSSFTTQVTPLLMNEEFHSDGKFPMRFPSCSKISLCTSPTLMESDIDSDQYRPSNEISDPSGNKQADLESTPEEHGHFLSEGNDSDPQACIMKKGCAMPERHHLKKRVEHLLREAYEKSFRMLEDSFESHKNLEDEEIQKIQELLLSVRKEVDGLQKQNISESKQWQRKLNDVVLQVASKLPAEKKHPDLLPQELEEPLQGLDLGSQSLLCVDTEHQVQIPAKQAIDPLGQLELYGMSSESTTFEAENSKISARAGEANRTEDEESICQAICMKFRERGLLDLDTESRNAIDISINSPNYPRELSFLPSQNTDAMPVNTLESQRAPEKPLLEVEQTCNKISKPFPDVEESSKRADILLMEIQNLKSGLDSKDKELAAERTACAELDKTVVALKKEKGDLNESLKSVTFDNQQLSYSLMALGIELEKVKSDMEMYKARLSNTTETLEDLEMDKADWTERLLETENELRRIKSEKANIENHALSMETDIEELQLKNEHLEKENENKLKSIFGLQEQLHILVTERNQFSQDLSALLKDKEESDQMCQKMQKTIKELESSKGDSAEFIRILEAEANTQAKLLQAAKADTHRLSTEKDRLLLQLQNLDQVMRALVLEKEAVQSQIEHLNEEKEVSLREYETLHSKLSISEMEYAKISKSLEGSLIEKGELATRLNSAQEELSQLRRGIEKLKIKIESDEKKRCHLAGKLKESERKADSLADRIENLERELQMSEDNLEDAILQAETAKAETETATAEIEMMCATLQSLECEVNALKLEKGSLERELKENQDKVSDLEGLNSMLVKQLEEREKEKVQIRGEFENALMSMESQLKLAREEVKLSHCEEENFKTKEQDLMDEVACVKEENGWLAHHLQEAKHKHSEMEHLLEVLAQQFQDLIQKLDDSDPVLEQLPKNETLQSSLEATEVELEAATSEKPAFLEKANSHQQTVQLKTEFDSFHHRFQHWLKTYTELKQEKKVMVKQIHELQIQLKKMDPGSDRNATAEEIRLELEELKELVEEKTAEADQNLDKYCTLIIDYDKLEEENEMLKTQVSLLNTRLKQSSDSSSSPLQSPGSQTKITNGLLVEKDLSEDITVRRQSCHENRNNGESATSPFPEAASKQTKRRTTFQQHSPKVPLENAEFESDGSTEVGGKGSSDIPPGNGSSCISHGLIPRASPCLVRPNLRSPPFTDDSQTTESDCLLENQKATPEGSKLQKINDVRLQEILAAGSPMGFAPRSPLSACNQSAQAVDGRPARTPSAIETKSPQSTEENELDKACHVQ
ncbi:centromere protein F [Podarcis raffonei]|uniref:centromere protein F n=1 Tax=Podarcis raffonei TaxID=65483 RepID=UPI0023294D32|nr:centromere protein F [Podarcis raffonei]XP_053239161.1 centromere protein F [Podarcis raffonei]XP_053239162.1 centromere protein F [Podarcis raffonei]